MPNLFEELKQQETTEPVGAQPSGSNPFMAIKEPQAPQSQTEPSNPFAGLSDQEVAQQFDPRSFPSAEAVANAGRGTLVGEAFDFISRPNFAAASGVAEWDRALAQPDASLWDAFNVAARGFVRGLTGQQKDTFYDLALEKFQVIKNDPNVPGWLKTAYGHLLGTAGFASDLVLDPLNLVSPVAIASKIGRVTKTTPVIQRLARDLRQSRLGQVVLERFSSFGTMTETEFVHRMRQLKHEMQALEAQALRQNIPREQMIRDLERQGISRAAIMDFLERPKALEELDSPQLVRDLGEGVDVAKTVQVIDPELVPEEFRTIRLSDDEAITVNTVDDAKNAREALVGKELDNMVTEIQLSEVQPGGLISATDPISGIDEVVGRHGTISTTPDWFRNKGWTREQVTNALERRNPNSPVFQQLEEIAKQRLNGELGRGMFRDDGLPEEWFRLNTMLHEDYATDVATAVYRERFVNEWPDLRPVEAHFTKWNDEQLNFEKNVLGVNIDELYADDEARRYMGHYLTPEAKNAGINLNRLEAAMDTKVEIPQVDTLRAEARRTIQHGSTKQRQIKHLTATEINNLPKEAKEQIFGVKLAEDIPIYIDDPVKSQVIRDLLSARATGMVRFLEDVTDNPAWAVRLEEGQTAPPGWRKLKGKADDGFGRIVEGVYFHPEIADAFEELVEKSYDPDRVDSLLHAYDTFIRGWKRITLGTSPRWMVNNALGNLWNGVILADMDPLSFTDALRIMKGEAEITIEAGDTLSDIAERYGVSIDTLVRINNLRDPNLIVAGQTLRVPGQAIRTTRGGRAWTREEILGEAERRGIIGTGFFGGVAGLGDQSIEDALRQAQGSRNPIFRANKALEEVSRLALFADGLKKGMSPEEATKRTFRYLFDYTDLANFEREWLNNRFWPFYTWWRKNTSLQLQELARQPGKFAIIPKTTRVIESDQDLQEKRTLPDFRQASVQIGREGDVTEFASLRSIPAMELFALAQDPLESIANANPILSAFMAARGFSTFRGEEIPRGFRTEFAIPGVGNAAIPTRAFETAATLLPPLRTLQGITTPINDPRSGLPPRTQLDELLAFLTGSNTFQRSESQDLSRFFRDQSEGINDSLFQVLRSILLGLPASQEAAEDDLFRRLEQLSQ